MTNRILNAFDTFNEQIKGTKYFVSKWLEEKNVASIPAFHLNIWRCKSRLSRCDLPPVINIGVTCCQLLAGFLALFSTRSHNVMMNESHVEDGDSLCTVSEAAEMSRGKHEIQCGVSRWSVMVLVWLGTGCLWDDLLVWSQSWLPMVLLWWIYVAHLDFGCGSSTEQYGKAWQFLCVFLSC